MSVTTPLDFFGHAIHNAPADVSRFGNDSSLAVSRLWSGQNARMTSYDEPAALVCTTAPGGMASSSKPGGAAVMRTRAAGLTPRLRCRGVPL